MLKNFLEKMNYRGIATRAFCYSSLVVLPAACAYGSINVLPEGKSCAAQAAAGIVGGVLGLGVAIFGTAIRMHYLGRKEDASRSASRNELVDKLKE